MLICEYCGEVWGEDSIGTSQSYLCTIGGRGFYETVMDDCPNCGGELIEAKKCEACEEWKNPEKDMRQGDTLKYVCHDCLKKESTPKMAYIIGEDFRENISVNGFIAQCFTPKEINDILKKELFKKGECSVKAKEYCLADTTCLADYIAEQCQ